MTAEIVIDVGGLHPRLLAFAVIAASLMFALSLAVGYIYTGRRR